MGGTFFGHLPLHISSCVVSERQLRPPCKGLFFLHVNPQQCSCDRFLHVSRTYPFTEKIPKAEQVTDLRENDLIPELPGILAWAVQGCLEWQKTGLQVPPEVEAETKKYRNEMDLVSGATLAPYAPTLAPIFMRPTSSLSREIRKPTCHNENSMPGSVSAALTRMWAMRTKPTGAA